MFERTASMYLHLLWGRPRWDEVEKHVKMRRRMNAWVQLYPYQQSHTGYMSVMHNYLKIGAAQKPRATVPFTLLYRRAKDSVGSAKPSSTRLCFVSVGVRSIHGLHSANHIRSFVLSVSCTVLPFQLLCSKSPCSFNLIVISQSHTILPFLYQHTQVWESMNTV